MKRGFFAESPSAARISALQTFSTPVGHVRFRPDRVQELVLRYGVAATFDENREYLECLGVQMKPAGGVVEAGNDVVF